MSEYHKINGVYKRYGFDERPIPDGFQKGDMIDGEWSLPEFWYLQNNEWIWTEKLDGTNIRIEITDTGIEIRGKTDRAVIPKDLHAWLQDLVYTRLGSTITGKDTTLYLEGVGEKIQGGGAFGKQHAKLIDVNVGGTWMNKRVVLDIAQALRIDHAPVVLYGSIHQAISFVQQRPKSEFGDFVMEGLVGQPYVPIFGTNHQRICAKVKVKDHCK